MTRSETVPTAHDMFHQIRVNTYRRNSIDMASNSHDTKFNMQVPSGCRTC